jgi:hypothetical protein
MSADPALSDRRRRLLEELLSGAAAAREKPGEKVRPHAPGQIVPL